MLLVPHQHGASRKPQYKDAYRRTIEILQRTHTFKVNCCLKIFKNKLEDISPDCGATDTPVLDFW